MESFDGNDYSEASRLVGLTNYRYGNCNCLTFPSCVRPVYTKIDISPTFYFDGFFVGCYILEAVLRSSMRCLYSQKCIDFTISRVLTRLQQSVPLVDYSLDAAKNSSYTVNTTISQLLDNLMTETWGQTTSHRSYFQACKPLSCTYTYTDRREWTYIITLLFGLVGGLDKVLRIIVPRFVSIIMKCIHRNEIVPFT